MVSWVQLLEFLREAQNTVEDILFDVQKLFLGSTDESLLTLKDFIGVYIPKDLNVTLNMGRFSRSHSAKDGTWPNSLDFIEPPSTLKRQIPKSFSPSFSNYVVVTVTIILMGWLRAQLLPNLHFLSCKLLSIFPLLETIFPIPTDLATYYNRQVGHGS